MVGEVKEMEVVVICIHMEEEVKGMEVVVTCKCTVEEERVMEAEEIYGNMVGICLHKEVVVMTMVEVGTYSNMVAVVHDLVVLGVDSNCLVGLRSKAYHHQQQHY
jgi:hypothetical protein